ncbi:FAD:protein FMN transferase [hydrothermal vent metagenome]|uniref:FAD:protein FMN transferase n=1 Tax=hydrothermal vent metagenome TaxID=652676 RepID=A0A3B1BGS1_9ZZZZ
MYSRIYRLSLLLILFNLLLPTSLMAQWFEDEQAIMGTPIRVELWSDDASEAKAAIKTVMSEIQRIDALMSPFKDNSELARINQQAGDTPVILSKELFQLILRAETVSEMTGGVFDISFASVGYLYDYRKGIHPSTKEIKAQLPAVNYRAIKLDSKTRSIFFSLPGMRIDLGGIAKGYAVDKAAHLLRQRGIQHALVSAGGDSRLLGDRHGRPWMIGIRHPRDTPKKTTAEKARTSPVVLPLSNIAISTSGDYERFFIRDGVRYHHIINTKTGRAARASQSATVIGPDATLTDALSTSVFILGAKKGIALINRLPGFDAVVIDSHGQLYYSDGLMPPQK